MASVYRVAVTWTGFPGAPGYTKFSFSDLTTDAARNAAAAALKLYFETVKNYQPNLSTITFNPAVQEFNVESGELVGEAPITTVPAAVLGGASAVAYAGGSGYFVAWKTSTIYGGRKVQGRTFHVPAVSCYENDGTLSSAAIAIIQGAGATLVSSASAELCVWAKSWSKDPVPQQIGGELAPVTVCVVKDMATQLRSRRN